MSVMMGLLKPYYAASQHQQTSAGDHRIFRLSAEVFDDAIVNRVQTAIASE